MPINRNILKTYAPQARREFIQAVTDRASVLGLSEHKIEPVEVTGDVAIIAGRPFPKEVAASRKKLEDRIALNGFTQVMEEIAYTWFNRFTALRYMELHGYLGHGYHVLSNPSGSDIPEILEKATSVDLPGLDKEKVAEWRLAGDKDAELYQMLLMKQCNALHRVMPALFEAVNDATELLLPQNLLQSNSPIRKLVNDIPEENWSEIEIVGWLYQFYISEKKDQVIGKVVKSEDIPAATQLFTPNWIVKYMVQNTLGRKWLMTYPGSSIKGKMEFYIEPAEQVPEVQAQLDAIIPKELNPEELTFMDPACGSGHILAEAYDLFKDIYQERGYRTRDIPRLILEKNLYGLDIDDRAAQLARFTVLMKARADDRRILDPDNPAKLNIIAIQESKGLEVDAVASVLLRERVKEIGSKGAQQLTLVQPKMVQGTLSETEKPDVTKEELFLLLHLFEDGKTFGSLLTVHDKLMQALPRLEKLVAKGVQASDMESRRYAEALLPLIKQATLLGAQYDYVVANPPYMGSKGLNPKLKEYAKNKYPDSKSDLFAMFIERGLSMVSPQNYLSMITMESWMFLSSYEKFRINISSENTIESLGHFPYDGKRPTVMGINFGVSVLSLRKIRTEDYYGTFFCSRHYELDDDGIPLDFPTRNERYKTAANSNFKKIPGSPIAYWVSESFLKIFDKNDTLGERTLARQGLATGDNSSFARLWHEINIESFCKEAKSCADTINNGKKWYPYNKGGDFRRWYGNLQWVVDWENDGERIRSFRDENGKLRSRPQNTDCYFRDGITWSDVTSGHLSMRILETGCIYDISGHSAFPKEGLERSSILAYMNTKFAKEVSKMINPTLHFQIGDYQKFPYPKSFINTKAQEISERAIALCRSDWDAYENSWDFQSPLIIKTKQPSLCVAYSTIAKEFKSIVSHLQTIEENNNILFNDAYHLNNDLSPVVALNEITLTCNPHYRYGPGKTEEEYEALQYADSMKELISHSIGCMMGRYSLDEPGLIYAHSGNEGFDPSRYTTFPADEDGIVPVMDDDWFEDDATKRFEEFLRVAWLPETLDENLKFVADSLEPKQDEKPLDTIRRFISQKFFKDHHLKVYKKRPIYWLFSSGKHKAFECLVYLHRYNENTLARMRTMYVTPLQGKFNARIEFLNKEKDSASSASSAKKLQKKLDGMRKKQQEIREFDELLRHYADQRIKLDLDDGVKVNYSKFGSLLAEVKAITGDSGD